MEHPLNQILIDILLESLSRNTFKQYQSALKEWYNFCNEKQYDCYDVSISTVLQFLTVVHDKGAKYGTLNCYRSALVLILGKIMDNELISRFMRGVYRKAPALPRYDYVWDPGLVLNKLATMYPNESISLELLSKKVITLIALITAHRIQTLSLIKITNIIREETRILIKN